MDIVQVLAVAAGASALVALLLFDLRRTRLPDGLNLLLALAGLAFHAAADDEYATWPELALGAAVGAGLFYAMRLLYFRLRGVEALGLGDVKFMAAAGLWVGIGGIAPLILIAALTTLLVVAVRHGRALTEESLRRRRIPFGPGLAFGLAVVMAGQLSGLWPL